MNYISRFNEGTVLLFNKFDGGSRGIEWIKFRKNFEKLPFSKDEFLKIYEIVNMECRLPAKGIPVSIQLDNKIYLPIFGYHGSKDNNIFITVKKLRHKGRIYNIIISKFDDDYFSVMFETTYHMDDIYRCDSLEGLAKFMNYFFSDLAI